MNPVRKSIEIYDAKISFISLVDRPANRRSFLLTKSEDKPDDLEFSGVCKIIDAVTESVMYVAEPDAVDIHFVTGVAYEPMVADTDDNYMTAEEIQKMAHWFLKNGRMVDEQHDFEQNLNCQIVESWIAPNDGYIGDQEVKKGAWLVKIEVKDPEIWKKIENGDITGFSIGGVAKYGTEEVDLDQMSEEGDSAVDKVMNTADVGTSEKRSFLATLAKFFGMDAESEAISKGAVADEFADRIKCEGFWYAKNALDNALRHYDWQQDKYVFNGDPQIVADALADFTRIVTGLMTSSPEQIVTAIAGDAQTTENEDLPIEKAGKKISAARMSRLKAIQDAVNDLVSDLSDEEEENEDPSDEEAETNGAGAEDGEGVDKTGAGGDKKHHGCVKEENEMTQEEIMSVAKAVAQALKEDQVDEQVEKAETPDIEPAPAPAETITKAEAEQMIQDAVAKAMQDDSDPAKEPVEYITKADAEAMVKAAVEEVKKARGAATNLNDEHTTIQKDDDSDFWKGVL